jgi:hypothetical protein
MEIRVEIGCDQEKAEGISAKEQPVVKRRRNKEEKGSNPKTTTSGGCYSAKEAPKDPCCSRTTICR